jgi:hypothetical protein
VPRPHVVLEGDFRVPTSLALINRELGRRLAVHPAFDFTAVEHALPDLRVEIAPELTGCMVAPDQLAGTPDVRIWHRWPPALQRLPARRFILMQPWEFGELPIAWRDAALDEVDQIWAYSGYVKGIYERAGIPPEKVVVVPLGVDPERFTPQGPKLDLPARGLRALFVGGSIRRKGIDVAVNAFLTAFSASDDVTLVIKDFAQLYPTNNLGAQVAEIAARDGVAHILYYDGMLTDADVAVPKLRRLPRALSRRGLRSAGARGDGVRPAGHRDGRWRNRRLRRRRGRLPHRGVTFVLSARPRTVRNGRERLAARAQRRRRRDGAPALFRGPRPARAPRIGRRGARSHLDLGPDRRDRVRGDRYSFAMIVPASSGFSIVL